MNIEEQIGRLSLEAKNLSEFLEEACRLRGKPVTTAAEEAGMARNAISSFIRGTRRPSPRSVHLLARYFGVRNGDILRLQGYGQGVPALVLEGLGDGVLHLVRGMDAEEVNEWIQYGEMMALRRQRRMMERGLEEEAGGGEVEGESE